MLREGRSDLRSGDTISKIWRNARASIAVCHKGLAVRLGNAHPNSDRKGPSKLVQYQLCQVELWVDGAVQRRNEELLCVRHDARACALFHQRVLRAAKGLRESLQRESLR